MKDTSPIFILGSGRSGTLQMVKMLEQMNGIEAHHEYLFENILKTAVLYRMGKIRKVEAKMLLMTTHVPAVHYSKNKIWVDSSNALPWIIKPLYELFPNARFIHLLRDGRKVVSSFYHKFTEEMYADDCVDILQKWLENPELNMAPSPEKKYWRPLPMIGENFYAEFAKYNRFERLCYYWQDCNIQIKSALDDIPEAQKLTIHLEDVVSDQLSLSKFLGVFGVEADSKHLQILRKPVNVAIPKNFLLTNKEAIAFEKIAGDAMKIFGYRNKKEYSVEY
ncbi:sulfotransferase [Polynucleobacter paneuropaeus]|nr:sulfotransferase [Polynucleobacter paneuropaeus]